MQILNQLRRWVAQFFRLQRTDGLGVLARKVVPRGTIQTSSLSAKQKAILDDVYRRATDTYRQRGDATVVLFTGTDTVHQRESAEALANDLQRDLYLVDLNAVVSRYIGETEKNLRALFRAAASTKVILFFDEADALFERRSDVKDSHDRYANIEINFLLQQLEEYEGLAILATNNKDAIDKISRFHLGVDFPCPRS